MIIPVITVIVLSLIGVLGDYFLKVSGGGEKYIHWGWFFIGLLVYSSTAIGWFFVMKHIKLGTLGGIYAVTTILALAIIGLLFFKETLNYYEITGLIIGIVAITLLARFA